MKLLWINSSCHSWDDSKNKFVHSLFKRLSQIRTENTVSREKFTGHQPVAPLQQLNKIRITSFCCCCCLSMDMDYCHIVGLTGVVQAFFLFMKFILLFSLYSLNICVWLVYVCVCMCVCVWGGGGVWNRIVGPRLCVCVCVCVWNHLVGPSVCVCVCVCMCVCVKSPCWAQWLGRPSQEPGVSILWLGEVESLICNYCVSVATHTFV